MSNTNTLEIIQGLAQAAANAYDGAHDSRISYDGSEKRVGLRREEGCPIHDSRVMDGFKVKFSADSISICYQSDIKLKELHTGRFEENITFQINEIKNFLQKEYKAITGKRITLIPVDEAKVLVQSTSRVRSFVNAYQWFKISRLKADPIIALSENKTDNVIKGWLHNLRSK